MHRSKYVCLQEKKKLELEEMNRVLAELGIEPNAEQHSEIEPSKGKPSCPEGSQEHLSIWPSSNLLVDCFVHFVRSQLVDSSILVCL